MTAPNQPAAPMDAQMLPPSCEAVSPLLTALLDGELSDHQADAVRDHLAACLSCGRELDALRRLYGAAGAWQPAAPDNHGDLWKAVRSRISSSVAPVRRAPPDRHDMRVAARLQAKGVLTTAQFEQAVAEHDKAAPGVRLFDMLVELGFASETEVTRARAEIEGVPFIDLERFPPEPGALATVPEDLAHRHQALPMRKDGPNLFVAMADPRDIHAIDEIRVASRCTVRAMLAGPDHLREALARAYPGSATPSTPAADLPTHDEQNETLALIVRELQTLRAEVKQLRNEVARLHEQRATTSSGGPGARSSSRLLFPYARPDDTPRHIV